MSQPNSQPTSQPNSQTGPCKAIFVTGAASGIGRATARLFASKGWFVGAYDVNEPALASLRDEIGADSCHIGRLDVSDIGNFRQVASDFARATGGRLDILHNNAGISGAGALADIPLTDVRRILDVNVMGTFNGIHTCMDLLKQTPGALCLSTSSASGLFGMPFGAAYSASKAALKALTESLSIELHPFDIRVSVLFFGMIDTPLVPAGVVAQAPEEGVFRASQPEQAAELVWRAYHSDTLYLYLPEELSALHVSIAQDPDGMRAQLLGGALAGVSDTIEEAVKK